MNVTIRFFIDEETLIKAVLHYLYFHIEPSFPERKESHQKCSTEQWQLHSRFSGILV
ncbi:hypothetical protein QUW57_13435 [Phocaeicola plebeius]|uniref:hypothetical protein n=1 Tax=Phocaeicola plebeius TaxID=310297 RepID=UPI0021ACB39C|nr:hypothetical protein [Phocaeicola plebeius]MCR8884464.1 hypothetical protein [Phocaeicola plebeius]MDM8287572.1 hypothetical protein [Phocaeicola plebeius]